MHIKIYLDELNTEEKKRFASDCGTSLAYLSQLANGHRRAGIKSMAAIEKASKGQVTSRDLRPDLFCDVASL